MVISYGYGQQQKLTMQKNAEKLLAFLITMGMCW
jgi:hypothetical protein